MVIQLGVLDQIPIRSGGSARQAIEETFQLAALADRLGFSRYWLAEHHNTGTLACPAPEVLIPQVAARTERIRVGSGGVMLPHYSPLKVAEVFRTISTLHPGRIDLGIGRAPGSDGLTSRAMVHGPGALGIERFPEQLMDLYGFLADDLPSDHEYRGVRAMPPDAPLPELWLLGSSNVGAVYAAELGWAYSFAQFISPEGGENLVKAYRESFSPSPALAEPRANLGVSVICAETQEEAERLSWSRWCMRIRHNRGIQSDGIPSPEEAMAFPYTQPELDYVSYMQGQSIHGTPQHCRERLEELARTYDVDEFIVLTITFDAEARRHSYELLAEVFDLGSGSHASEQPAASEPAAAPLEA